MPYTKEAARGKRSTKAVPLLEAAGLSLSLAIGMSAAIGSVDPNPATSAIAAQQVMDDEQISDVSLATFHVFDNDGVGPEWSGTPANYGQPRCLWSRPLFASEPTSR
jgi:hypothetical protein